MNVPCKKSLHSQWVVQIRIFRILIKPIRALVSFFHCVLVKNKTRTDKTKKKAKTKTRQNNQENNVKQRPSPSAETKQAPGTCTYVRVRDDKCGQR